jgi:uncharacterized tellurite resistance protein B-like protein
MSDKSTLQALAFLYLTFGHSTDGSMTGDEMRSLGNKLKEWAPDAPLSELGEVLKAVVAEYKGAGDKLAKASEYTQSLKGTINEDQAKQVLTDLRSIASADGAVSDAEAKFIADTAAVFGIDV